MTRALILSAAAVAGLSAAPAMAQLSPVASNLPARLDAPKTASGSAGDLRWEARNLIVGQTATGDASGGGNPIYFANKAANQGVVTLIMEYDGIGAFICTGSAINSNKILTAAHCVSDGFGTAGPDRVRAYFTDSIDPNFRRVGPSPDRDANPGAIAIDVSHIHVNPGYTGQVIDQNDIAVLSLSEAIPDYAVIYDLYTTPELRNEQFTVVGNGGRSTIGGAFGSEPGTTGLMREGENTYDFRVGDPIFEGIMTAIFGPPSRTEFTYLTDFDNGLAANDAACRLLQAANFNSLSPAVRASFCNLGVGAREVGVAGGDSGGPQFIDGKIASVTSYGVTFGPNFGDFRAGLNSSWGEFSGWVPVYIHEDWIGSVVPEPATWAMMIAGFGLVGMTARRRRSADLARATA